MTKHTQFEDFWGGGIPGPPPPLCIKPWGGFQAPPPLYETLIEVPALTNITLGSPRSVVLAANVTFRGAALSDNNSWDCLWKLPTKNVKFCSLRTFGNKLESDWLPISLKSANPVAIKLNRVILALECFSKVSHKLSKGVEEARDSRRYTLGGGRIQQCEKQDVQTEQTL